MPALPLHEAGKYVAAAYIVFFGLILIYVAIMAARLSRVERDLGELLALAQRRREGSPAAVATGDERPLDHTSPAGATPATAAARSGTGP